MKIILMLFLISALNAFSQDFDSIFVKKQLECSDVSYNCSLLFEKYFTEDKLDSSKRLLIYWEEKCGMREPMLRAKLLIAFKENNFQDYMLTYDILNYIFNYLNRIGNLSYRENYFYEYYKPYYGYIPPNMEFDKFSKNEFRKLKSKFEITSMEYLLCDFYSDNYPEIFSKLQSQKYKNSVLTKKYYEKVEKYLNEPELHYSLITGIWIPTGNLNILGIHPELGCQIGAKYLRWNLDLVFVARLGNSANKYYARRTKEDSLELTDHYFGGHIGIDVGYDIFINNPHEIQLTGGIAFDGFDALEENKELSLNPAFVSSYNINLGFGYRYYLSHELYIGLRTKYNVVDYSLNKIIDFTGNQITIQFLIGGLSNVFRNNSLRALHYNLRDE